MHSHISYIYFYADLMKHVPVKRKMFVTFWHIMKELGWNILKCITFSVLGMGGTHIYSVNTHSSYVQYSFRDLSAPYRAIVRQF